MLPNRLDSESRRKNQIGGGKVTGTSTAELDRMADKGMKFILFSFEGFGLEMMVSPSFQF